MEKNGKNASTFKQNRKRYNYEVEIIILFSLVALLSCQKVEKGYYKSGALRYERMLLDKEKKLYHQKAYYPNGNIESDGNVYENHKPEGHWKEYYSDGVLRWEGEYKEGLIDTGSDTIPQYAKYENNIEVHATRMKKGKTYEIRALTPKVHPLLYKLAYLNYDTLVANPNNPDLYPYLVTPTHSGKFPVMIVFPNKDGYYIKGDFDNVTIFEFDVEE